MRRRRLRRSSAKQTGNGDACGVERQVYARKLCTSTDRFTAHPSVGPRREKPSAAPLLGACTVGAPRTDGAPASDLRSFFFSC